MNKEKELEKLKYAQVSRGPERAQVDFLFADITKAKSYYSQIKEENIGLGKYDSFKRTPFQFYKPYSKIFNLNKIDTE